MSRPADSFQGIAESGSLPLALLVSALAGLVSFASPCVLPLVPGYLGYVTGLTGVDLERQRRGRMFLGATLFVLGFTVVFVLLAAAFGAVGSHLVEHQLALTRVLGALTIVLGLVFVGWFPGSERQWRPRWRPAAGLLGAPLLGAVFGLGWIPCIGPTLSAVLALASNEGSASRGAALATAYCLGLGLPFLATALAFGRLARAWSAVRRHQRLVQLVGGALLVGVGILLVTGAWTDLVHSVQRHLPFTPAV
ncbi:MAG: cytochrome c biogenesis CcdA family protein [Actinomycetales bacterium]